MTYRVDNIYFTASRSLVQRTRHWDLVRRTFTFEYPFHSMTRSLLFLRRSLSNGIRGICLSGFACPLLHIYSCAGNLIFDIRFSRINDERDRKIRIFGYKEPFFFYLN